MRYILLTGVPNVPPVSEVSLLLLETGDGILLETGDGILIE